MAQKRKHNSHASGTQQSSKRPRNASSNWDPSIAQLDATSGQRGAFPELDGTEDFAEGEDDVYEEAMAYLRGVRSEAFSIPSVLVNATRDTYRRSFINGDGSNDIGIGDEEDLYDDEEEEDLGFYSDGAYVAAPRLTPPFETRLDDGDQPNNVHQIPAATAYRTALLNRYQNHRASIAHSPLLGAETSSRELPPLHTYRNPSQTELYTWLTFMTTTSPHPTQLHTIFQDSKSALKLAEIIAQLLRRRLFTAVAEDYGISGASNLGMWIWGVLGALAEPGTMGSEEIGVIRALGKKAVKLAWGVRGGAEEEVEDLESEYEEHEMMDDNNSEGAGDDTLEAEADVGEEEFEADDAWGEASSGPEDDDVDPEWPHTMQEHEGEEDVVPPQQKRTRGHRGGALKANKIYEAQRRDLMDPVKQLIEPYHTTGGKTEVSKDNQLFMSDYEEYVRVFAGAEDSQEKVAKVREILAERRALERVDVDVVQDEERDDLDDEDEVVHKSARTKTLPPLPPSRRRRRNSSSSISSVDSANEQDSASEAAALAARKAALLGRLGLPADTASQHEARTTNAHTTETPEARPLAPQTSQLHSKQDHRTQVKDKTPSTQTASARAPPSTITAQAGTGDMADTSPQGIDKRREVATQILRFTLDAILTVVGEIYGQRDLLPARDALWEVGGL